ncbi:MAG: asparagine synthase (glutamine-hydrolyzing) [Thermodesulfobacteriota bacterium]
MCGIFGCFGTNITPDIEEEVLKALSHRGPDDRGAYRDNKTLMIHTRLSIIDLTRAGHQPMLNDSGSLVIVYNGEVYNFRDIREILEKDHNLSFRSDTDTEVILKAYEVWGEACLNRLRGMFSFAILDKDKRKLFLARDRLGQKPLFYYWDEKRFAFASELQALLKCKEIPREVNSEAIHYFLSYQYIPAPLSGFKGISKLPPAHYITRQDGKVTVKKYWDIDFSKKIKVVDERELCEEVIERLKESIRIRLVSDVPLGAFLSGGVDSSVIVALMSDMTKGPVKTFSIGFEEEGYNEIPYARQVANLFGTEHNEFIVKYDATEILPELVKNYGEPFADSSALPTFYLSRMTRAHITVALSGDGGDENLAGYDRYLALKLVERLRLIPSPFYKVMLYFLNCLSQSHNVPGKARRLRRLIEGVTAAKGEEYFEWILNSNKDEENILYSPSFSDIIKGLDSRGFIRDIFERSSADKAVERAMDADIHSYLPYDLLVKVDITSMSNSLEVRSPFLDHQLMEFMASIPLEYKLKGTIKKYILKRAFRDTLPHNILHRPKKGFGVPLENWFRKELRGYAYDHLLSKEAIERGYFNNKAVEKLLNEHTSGMRNHSYTIWSLLMLELWLAGIG